MDPAFGMLTLTPTDHDQPDVFVCPQAYEQPGTFVGHRNVSPRHTQSCQAFAARCLPCAHVVSPFRSGWPPPA